MISFVPLPWPCAVIPALRQFRSRSMPHLSQIRGTLCLSLPRGLDWLMVEPKGGSKNHRHNCIPRACRAELRRTHTRRLGGKTEERIGSHGDWVVEGCQPKSLQMVAAARKLKGAYSLEEKLRELRAFFSCMAWRAIPGPLSKRKRPEPVRFHMPWGN